MKSYTKAEAKQQRTSSSYNSSQTLKLRDRDPSLLPTHLQYLNNIESSHITMPSKVNTGIRDYLSDQKDKLAEYQRNGGEHKLENANFKFIVHAVSGDGSVGFVTLLYLLCT